MIKSWNVLSRFLVGWLFVFFCLCTKAPTTAPEYNDIFIGNWTQAKNYYKGPPDNLSIFPYGSWEIHFVTRSKWREYWNHGDSVVCSEWSYFIRNDSLIRFKDNVTEVQYFVGLIAKVNDTITIDKSYVTIWLAGYNADTLPGDWSKNIVYEP